MTFHDVTDLRIALDFGRGNQARNLNELSIASIDREQVEHSGCRPYWRWRIALNDPVAGEITFGASGYSQLLRDQPKLVSDQRLPAAERAAIRL